MLETNDARAAYRKDIDVLSGIDVSEQRMKNMKQTCEEALSKLSLSSVMAFLEDPSSKFISCIPDLCSLCTIEPLHNFQLGICKL